MKIKKHNGHATDPCGISHFTWYLTESLLRTVQNWYRKVAHFAFLVPAEGCSLRLHQWGTLGPSTGPAGLDEFCWDFCGKRSIRLAFNNIDIFYKIQPPGSWAKCHLLTFTCHILMDWRCFPNAWVAARTKFTSPTASPYGDHSFSQQKEAEVRRYCGDILTQQKLH